MNGLRAALDELVRDVPHYGDLDRAMEQADQERRRRYGILTGLAAAAVVLVVIVGLLVTTRGQDVAPPPVAPTPTPTPSPSPSPSPSVQFDAPGPHDRPAAMYEAGGTLVMATIEQEEDPGGATLWRSHSGKWQKLGTLQHALPMHPRSDSGLEVPMVGQTLLSPGPGSQDIIAVGLVEDGAQSIGFSHDGGATWSYLAAPTGCGDCWIGAHGDYLYAVSELPSTLVRVAFGATNWEEVPLPESPDPMTGYRGPLVLDDGTLIMPEVNTQTDRCNPSSHYRISRDHGDTWSERRALPGTSTCIYGPVGNIVYASGDLPEHDKYRSTDLVNWEPIQVDVEAAFPPPENLGLPAVCSRRDPVYQWVSHPPLRVGDEVFRLFHVAARDSWNGVTHVLKVSHDDCRTWQNALP